MKKAGGQSRWTEQAGRNSHGTPYELWDIVASEERSFGRAVSGGARRLALIAGGRGRGPAQGRSTSFYQDWGNVKMSQEGKPRDEEEIEDAGCYRGVF